MEILHDGIDAIENCCAIGQHPPRFQVERVIPQFQIIKYLGKPGSAEQPQDHLDSKIGLLAGNALRTQEPRQISGGRVGGIQLRQRWNQQ